MIYGSYSRKTPAYLPRSDAFDETMKRLLTNESTYEATAEIMRDTARVMTLAERRREGA